MIRRDMLKTSLATMISVPALPAIAGGAPRLGPFSVHAEPEFRNALMAYIDAYRAWRLMSPRATRKARRDVRMEWWDTMSCLRAMVLDNCGLSHDGVDHSGHYSPMGLASRMVDLGDMLIIAAVDATADELSEQFTGIVLVPRSQEMFQLLDGLPKEDIEDEDDAA
jgi:hypothetical protein